MSIVQEDAFWWADPSVPEEHRTMQGLCLECGKTKDCMFWAGKELGYGNYDLKCSICGKILHQRGEQYTEE